MVLLDDPAAWGLFARTTTQHTTSYCSMIQFMNMCVLNWETGTDFGKSICRCASRIFLKVNPIHLSSDNEAERKREGLFISFLQLYFSSMLNPSKLQQVGYTFILFGQQIKNTPTDWSNFINYEDYKILWGAIPHWALEWYMQSNGAFTLGGEDDGDWGWFEKHKLFWQHKTCLVLKSGMQVFEISVKEQETAA